MFDEKRARMYLNLNGETPAYVLNAKKYEREVAYSDLMYFEREISRFEINPQNYVNQFNDFLDEQSKIEIIGYPFSPSRVLRLVEPLTYGIELQKFADSMPIEHDKEYQGLLSERHNLKIKIEIIEDQIEILKSDYRC